MRTTTCTLLIVFVLHGSAQSLQGGLGGGSGGGGWLPSSLYSGLAGLGSTLNTDEIERPRDFEPRMVLGLGLSFQSAELTSSVGAAEASVTPWAGALLELGGSVTWRDRLSLALVGQWGLNGYLLQLDTVTNNLYHSSKRAEARFAWHTWPRRSKPMQWSFGLAFGCTFQNTDEILREDGSYRSVTTASSAMRPYIAPEFGRIGAEGKDRYEMAVRYVLHLDGAKGWETHAAMGSSEAVYSASDNYLGLVTRYNLGCKRAARPLPPAIVRPDEGRDPDTLAIMQCHQQRITLKLWDDAEVDGDTVSVLLNDVPVLQAYELDRRPLRISLELDYGTNRIQVIAHNEGRISPNTARCIVRRGKGREELLIKTSRKRSQVLLVTRSN